MSFFVWLKNTLLNKTIQICNFRWGPLYSVIVHLEQGNYSLRRPPKLIIQKIFNKQKWATVYRFMCNRICKSKCLVFQRHFDILLHNLSKITLDDFIRLFHLHWTLECNWKSSNVHKYQKMTLWPRHNWTLIRGQRRSTPQGTGWCAIKHATAAWKVPLKESSLHEPSSVTLRVILWTPSGPCAPWGASGPATTSPGPPSPSSSSSEILQNEEGTLKKARPRFYTIGALRPMGGLWASSNKSRAPFTLIIKFTGADSSPSKSSNSQHRIHRAWTLCLTRCTRCTSEATKKRE